LYAGGYIRVVKTIRTYTIVYIVVVKFALAYLAGVYTRGLRGVWVGAVSHYQLFNFKKNPPKFIMHCNGQIRRCK